jgi:hypothetical protein
MLPPLLVAVQVDVGGYLRGAPCSPNARMTQGAPPACWVCLSFCEVTEGLAGCFRCHWVTSVTGLLAR